MSEGALVVVITSLTITVVALVITVPVLRRLQTRRPEEQRRSLRYTLVVAVGVALLMLTPVLYVLLTQD